MDVRLLQLRAKRCSRRKLCRTGHLQAQTASEEIGLSRASIAAELGDAPRHFAYPNGGRGDFSERDVRLVRDAGFATATTSIEGVNRPGADPYRLLPGASVQPPG